MIELAFIVLSIIVAALIAVKIYQAGVNDCLFKLTNGGMQINITVVDYYDDLGQVIEDEKGNIINIEDYRGYKL